MRAIYRKGVLYFPYREGWTPEALFSCLATGNITEGPMEMWLSFATVISAFDEGRLRDMITSIQNGHEEITRDEEIKHYIKYYAMTNVFDYGAPN